MLPFKLTKDTPYLALSGELWSVFYEYFTEIDRVIKGFYCTATSSRDQRVTLEVHLFCINLSVDFCMCLKYSWFLLSCSQIEHHVLLIMPLMSDNDGT